ncbi:MAG TPA: preprotein translocase subunit YajC [Thermoanaerobaculia bacterium]|nr:preprotein translocase subunit YajC [Thermoanaerobaculia bacterium]
MNASNPLTQIGQFAPLLLIFALFYVLIMLPMRKRQKALAQLVDNLKKGDRVITNGGLYGEVAAVTGPTVVLKIADNVKVRIAKSAITGLEPEAEKGGNP